MPSRMVTTNAAIPSSHPLTAPSPPPAAGEDPHARRPGATTPPELAAGQALCDRLGEAAAAIAVAEILDELGVAADPRRIIEQSFLGREIVNIVVGEAPGRQERHERTTSWQRRLLRLGFSPLDMSGVGACVTTHLGAPAPFSVEECHGATSLKWKGEAVASVTAWDAR